MTLSGLRIILEALESVMPLYAGPTDRGSLMLVEKISNQCFIDVVEVKFYDDGQKFRKKDLMEALGNHPNKKYLRLFEDIERAASKCFRGKK